MTSPARAEISGRDKGGTRCISMGRDAPTPSADASPKIEAWRLHSNRRAGKRSHVATNTTGACFAAALLMASDKRTRSVSLNLSMSSAKHSTPMRPHETCSGEPLTVPVRVGSPTSSSPMPACPDIAKTDSDADRIRDSSRPRNLNPHAAASPRQRTPRLDRPEPSAPENSRVRPGRKNASLSKPLIRPANSRRGTIPRSSQHRGDATRAPALDSPLPSTAPRRLRCTPLKPASPPLSNSARASCTPESILAATPLSRSNEAVSWSTLWPRARASSRTARSPNALTSADLVMAGS